MSELIVESLTTVVTKALRMQPLTARHAGAAPAARQLDDRPHHPADLNFADCLVYGVAKSEREPLLFKGNDFAQTAAEPALKN